MSSRALPTLTHLQYLVLGVLRSDEQPGRVLRQALASFAALYNASWLRERHGHKTPDQIRAEQKALETKAATRFKLAA